jgi:hypothetical protein
MADNEQAGNEAGNAESHGRFCARCDIDAMMEAAIARSVAALRAKIAARMEESHRPDPVV